MIIIREYVDPNGRSPYARWFNRLDAVAAAKITIALTRLQNGISPRSKTFERQAHFGRNTRFGADRNPEMALKTVLRDYINATVGFTELGAATKRSPKSLMRMFGPSGNPQARNLFAVVAYLQEQEGVRFEVRQARR
jgi:hypothetical protein